MTTAWILQKSKTVGQILHNETPGLYAYIFVRVLYFSITICNLTQCVRSFHENFIFKM